MRPVPSDKWCVLIDQIKETENLNSKVDLLGTMVFMMATNDLACAEVERIEIKRQMATLTRKVVFVGISLALLILANVDIKSIIEFILRIAQ